MRWISADTERLFDYRQHAALVSELISTLPQDDVCAQLAQRHIRLVIVSRIPERRGFAGTLYPRGPYFNILLSPDLFSGEQLFVIGHEIGHTYAFTPVSRNGRLYFLRTFTRCGPLYSLEENFCDEFARQWMRTCGVQAELRKRLRKRVTPLVVSAEPARIDPATLQVWEPPIPDGPRRVLTPEEEAELPF